MGLKRQVLCYFYSEISLYCKAKPDSADFPAEPNLCCALSAGLTFTTLYSREKFHQSQWFNKSALPLTSLSLLTPFIMIVLTCKNDLIFLATSGRLANLCHNPGF